MNLVDSETAKYNDMWSMSQYREHSPGLENVPRFMDIAKPHQNASIIDLGCGEGVAGAALKEKNFRVWWLDLTDAQLCDGVDRKKFIQSALWGHWRGCGQHWDYGFCCDVMEHIPTEYTMLALSRMLDAATYLYLQICFMPDNMGALIGKQLHETVKPYQWWHERLGGMARILDARDLCGSGVFLVRRK